MDNREPLADYVVNARMHLKHCLSLGNASQDADRVDDLNGCFLKPRICLLDLLRKFGFLGNVIRYYPLVLSVAYRRLVENEQADHRARQGDARAHGAQVGLQGVEPCSPRYKLSA